MMMGSGTIKGFAYTLAVGIVISMFTALFVTRLLVNAFFAVGIKSPVLYGLSAKEKQGEVRTIDFLGKRKVFFGSTGRIDDLIPTMVKHKTEKYLVPMSDVHNDSLTLLLDSKKLNHKEVVMYRTVSNDFTPEEVKNFDYDMLIFFSPSGIESLTKNFPDFRQGEIAIATFGPATAKAAKDAGLRLDIEAPSEKYPSMTGALQHYLFEIQD
jgi:uroporphyrinogen-III synthase